MPLNRNTQPYFDDFTETKHHLSVLVKPGVALQARELNNLQSILQNQIKRFGDHLFQHGSMVIPGQVAVDKEFFFVKLKTIDPVLLLQLDPNDISNAGKNILVYGLASGITAQIVMVTSEVGSDPATLFVKYLSSGGSGTTLGTIKTFAQNEDLSLSNGGVIIATVEDSTTSTGKGSSATIQEGVYYINGYFVRVEPQTIILDKYSSFPTYKIGLSINDSFLTSDDDPTLTDNAAGSPNYAAPGADRYAVDLALEKRSFVAPTDEKFVEIVRVNFGQIEFLVSKTEYSIIEDEFAHRQFDTNGSFTVSPFQLDIREHLKDADHTQGVFPLAAGGDATKLAMGLEPGKAYVQGYEIQNLVTNYIPVDKARDFATDNNSVTRAFLGNYFLVDRLFGFPTYDSLVKIDLYDTKIATNGVTSGTKIGTAYARGVEYDSGTISNAATTFPYPVYKLFIFNISLNPGLTVTDIKSFYVASGTVGANASTGNVVSRVYLRNPTGLFASGDTLTDGANTGKIVSYDSNTGLTILEPATGIIPDSTVVSNGTFTASLVSRTTLFDTSNSILVYRLPQNVIKTVRAADSSIDTAYYTRKTFTQTTSSGSATFTASANEVFGPFNTTDYVITIEDASGDAGKILPTDSSNVSFGPGETTVTFNNIPNNGTHTVKLSATIFKQISQEKTKTLTDNSGTPLVIAAPAASVISLGKADIFDIVSITEVPVSGPNVDLTSRYSLDNGQRDNLYDLGSISLSNGQPPPAATSSVHIVFRYFTHSSGDYLSVDSYVNFNNSAHWYADIPTYTSKSSGITYNLRDCLDFRPRVDNNGTTFTSPGHLVKPNADVIADYQYYLKRIDKIYLDKAGKFNVIEGTASLNPVPPLDPKEGMVLYIVALDAYTFTIKDVKVTFIDNRRYTMRDIGKLETRIKTLEYYTALNLLEKETASLQIIDTTTGLNRFKNGFIVDPFAGSNIADVEDSDYRAAIDFSSKILRPIYHSSNVPFVFNGPNSSNFDSGISTDVLFKHNPKPNNKLISNKYTEVVLINQPYASNIINVNPYNLYAWIGSIVLTPPSDEWKDTQQRPDVFISDTGQYDSVLKSLNASKALGTVWGEWKTDWAGVPVTSVQDSVTATITNTTTTSQQSRTGITTTVSPTVSQTIVDNKVVNMAMIPFIRSRYIKFEAKRLKPFTRFFPYFDNVAIAAYCKPIGTITGLSNDTSTSLGQALQTDGRGQVSGWFLLPPKDDSDDLHFKTGKRIFRLTESEFNSVASVSFADATYTAAGVLETDQKTFTSIMVADVQKVSANQSQTITTTDQQVINKIIQPSPPPPSAETFPDNAADVPTFIDDNAAHRDAWFAAHGDPGGGSGFAVGGPPQNYTDPLAQSFLIQGNFDTGVFVSKLALYFQSTDSNLPVTVQIREMQNGQPTQMVVPFSEVVMYPFTGNTIPTTLADNTVYTSIDATVPTTAVFRSPVFLKTGTEYCFVVLADTNQYNIYDGVLGEKIIGSDNIISQQPYTGVLFKSKNASTWTPDQTADIKFTLYRCQFDTNSTGALVYFTSGDIPAETLKSLPFETSKNSNLIKILHADHGKPNGANVAIIIPAADPATTINGIRLDAITSNITLTTPGTATLAVTHVENDSYVITLSPSAQATASGRTGPDGVIVSGDRAMDVLYPLIQELIFSGTSVTWAIKATSTQSVNGTQAAFTKDNAFSPVQVNQDINFLAPRIIASPINESTLITGASAFDKKSLVLQANLVTTKDNLSAMIDTQRCSGIVISNRINNGSPSNTNVQDFDNPQEHFITGTDISFSSTDNSINWSSSNFDKFLPNRYIVITGSTISGNNNVFPNLAKIVSVNLVTKKIVLDKNTLTLATSATGPSVGVQLYENFIDETAPNSGSAPSKYICKRVTLENHANSLKVYLTAMRPSLATIDVYYRILTPYDTTPWEALPYTKLSLAPQIDGSASRNSTDFKEYIWEADSLPDFVSFSIKIVMKSTDSTQVPFIKDFRGIALGT